MYFKISTDLRSLDDGEKEARAGDDGVAEDLRDRRHLLWDRRRDGQVDEHEQRRRRDENGAKDDAEN